MASDFFLEIDGIKGESQDAKHKGEIDIQSFSWGVSQPGMTRGGGGGGGGAGKVSFQDMHFSKPVDATSPVLMQSCASGKHIKKATLSGMRSDGERGGFDYYKVELEDILVSSYQSAGSGGGGGSTDGGGGDVPTDQFSLNFTKITYTYTPQSEDGSKGTPSSGGWDLGTNKKL